MEPAHTEYTAWMKGIFNRSAQQYGQLGPRFFEYIGKTLADRAGIVGEDFVLDLACGRGSSLMPAAAQLRPPGMAVGVDLALEMLLALDKEMGGTDFEARNLSQMNVLNLGFKEGIFDVVQCGLALFFLPNLDQALVEARRVLKPGGRFVASTFGDRDERWNPVWERARLFSDRLAPIPEAEPQRLETTDEIVDAFNRAGFINIDVSLISKEFHYQSKQEWWQTMWSHGGRGLFERMDAAVLAEFKGQAFEILEGFRDEKRIPERFNILFTRARKPI